ncbi:stalk domain-containing protein [Thermosediminibacter oceani]|uniref:Copper amine oxidase domain protein n=1 Tax=Thermosediminibacter oceani (strain ATCC BAA-1034 / DSM 16646 / JW/IW-1228P) TaxID=555079 RepID=D9S097_THEOJ|nr:stalk domain-containing protein [Thermosediminibacter oceani]ADL07025.1 copper amine oxidase domain protein [Thermosediminibacter oceani DSM 16646]
MLKRRFAVFFLTVTIMLTVITPFTASAAAFVRVMLNGDELKFDVAPVLKNNRLLVPFRLLSENLGAGVRWDGRTKMVTAYKSETQVVLRVGSSTAYVNGKPVKLDVPAMLIQGRTLVPLRFYSEAFGAAVDWDGRENTVFIKTADKLSKYIMGYYYSQSYDDFINNVDKLSSIATKWYTLNSDCNLTSYDGSRWIMKPEGYDSVLRTARERGVKVHALVFESDRARLQQALATAEKRNALVGQILAEVDKENYDGVNIDFEYLGPEDKENFNAFIKDLYAALKSRNKTLSLSLPAKTEKQDWWPGYDYGTLGKYSDFVVLMAYDKSPSTPGPQAGVEWVEEIVNYALARIPAEKIVLGIGYYGYAWSGNEKYTVLEARNGMTYSKIWFLDELAQKYGLKMTIDSTSLMDYGSFTDEKGNIYQIWMESPKSVDAKSKLAIKKGLKGIAVWRLGYTTPSFWQAVNDNFIAAK